jgi:hypothetical protein
VTDLRSEYRDSQDRSQMTGISTTSGHANVNSPQNAVAQQAAATEPLAAAAVKAVFNHVDLPVEQGR